jgi:hypothetical protein
MRFKRNQQDVKPLERNSMMQSKFFTIETLEMIAIVWMFITGIAVVGGLVFGYLLLLYMSKKKLKQKKLPNISIWILFLDSCRTFVVRFNKNLLTTLKVWRETLNI